MMLRAGGTRLRPAPCRIRSMCGVVDGAWNPGDLTGLAATLLPAESRAAGLLWQNTAKTVAATADGDPVRVAVCPYTAVEFTAPSDAARPLLWDEGGGLWSLSFDGVDDLLQTASFARTGTGECVGQSSVVTAAGGSGRRVWLVGGTVSNQWSAFLSIASTYLLSVSNPVTNLNTTWGAQTGVKVTRIFTAAAGTIATFRNGTAGPTASVSPVVASPGVIAVGGYPGGGEHWAGRTAGLTVSAAPSTSERENLNTYLGAL